MLTNPSIQVFAILMLAIIALNMNWPWMLLLLILVIILLPPKYDPAIRLKEQNEKGAVMRVSMYGLIAVLVYGGGPVLGAWIYWQLLFVH